MTKYLFLKLAKLLKGRPIIIDDNLTIIELLNYGFEKLIMIGRGVLKTGKVIVIGRFVKISNLKKFKTGRGVEIGDYTQINCISQKGIKIGNGSKIGRFCLISVSGSLSDLGEEIVIGRNVGIGDFAHIGGAKRVFIGDDTITGSYLSIHPENHIFQNLDTPIRLQGVTRKGVSIGSDCWIGAKVTFLDGSSVGCGCIVGAGSIVNKVFSDNLIIAGVPAKVIGKRGN